MLVKKLTAASASLALVLSLVGADAIGQRSPEKKKAQAPAASSHAARWEKEPDSFMGMKFGKPLPECTKVTLYDGRTQYDYPTISREGHLCFTRPSGFETMPRAVNLPDIGTTITASWLYLVDERFEGMHLEFESSDYGRMESLFIARYGNPTDRVPVTLKNKMGLSMESVELFWRGRSITVRLARYLGELGTGGVDVYSEAYSHTIRDRSKADQDKYKGNL